MSTFYARGGPGPANTLTVGTVTTGIPGSDAEASITGAAPDQTLHLTIPRGEDGEGGASTWDEVADKPTEFPPSTHTHTTAQVSGLDAALSGKAAASHTHAPADISTTGATDGWVLTRGPGGVAAWSAPAAGGTPGVWVTGTSGAPPSGDAPTGADTVAIGNSVNPRAFTNSVFVGASSGITGPFAGFSSTAVGAYTIVSKFATAVGQAAKAQYDDSTALGRGAATTKANQVMLGQATQVVTCPGKVEVGTGAAMVTLSTRIVDGKSQLVAQHATGAAQIISQEP